MSVGWRPRLRLRHGNPKKCVAEHWPAPVDGLQTQTGSPVMSEKFTLPASDQPKRSPRRRIPASAWIIAVMVLLWLGAILSRNQIRAYWWTYRLESATTTADRLFYFHRLASLKDQAAGPVARLLEHQDPALRSFAVAVLHHASGPEVAQLLAAAAYDADDDVRRSALLGLALNGSPLALSALTQHLHGPDERAGMIAAAALVSAPSPAARSLLRDALHQSPYPGVRIEAINALEQLRDPDAVAALIAAPRATIPPPKCSTLPALKE